MIDLENMPAPTAEEIAQARENAFNADRPAVIHTYGTKLQQIGYHFQIILEDKQCR